MKYSIIEALEETLEDKEVAFRIANLVKFQKFTEMKDVDEVDVLNFR